MEKSSSKEDSAKGFVGNTTLSFFTSLTSRIGGFIFTIILARLLLPELFGVYSLVLSVVMLLASLLDFGVSQTLVVFISSNIKNKRKTASFFKFLFKIRFFASLAAGVLLFFLSGLISNGIFNNSGLILPLKIGAIYLFVNGLLTFFGALSNALKKFKFTFSSEIIFQILRIGFVALFLVLFVKVYLVFVALSISALVSAVLLFLLTRKKAPFLYREKPESFHKKKILSFMGFLTIGGLAGAFLTNIDALMLGALIPDTSYIGFYKIAVSMVFAVAALIPFVNVALTYFSSTGKNHLKNLFNKIIKYSFVLSLPLTAGLILLGRYLIFVFYGSEYLTAMIPLYVLSFLIINMPIAGVYHIIFISQKNPKIPTYLMIITSIINIVLNYFLITLFLKISLEYALLGAALATLISRILFTLVAGIIAKRKYSVGFPIKTIIKPIIATAIMSAFIFVFIKFIDINIFTGIAAILVSIIIYFAIILLIKGIEKEDLKKLFYLFKK